MTSPCCCASREPSAADAVAVRYVRDADPLVARAEIDRETDDDVWWRATFPVHNTATPYRWLLGGDFGYVRLNAMGMHEFDVPDADDFVVSPGAGGPDWHLESVVYQVFPDRFASSGLDVAPPEWAIKRDWDELPRGRGPDTPFEWFGGDLCGVEERLDHLSSLGVNILYLTPVFPAGSTHRYDATTFDVVDPLLGGDDAFESLVRAAHARGIRVLGDLTTNHVGSGHDWFVAAQEWHEPERGFFYFDEAYEHGYVCWVRRALTPEARLRIRRTARAHVRRSDIGCAPLARASVRPRRLAHRRREHDGPSRRDRPPARSRERRSKGSPGAVRPDALVVGEHAHDARADLRAGAWHGAMNYAGFTRPVWAWLRGETLPTEPANSVFELPVGIPKRPGESMVRHDARVPAGVPGRHRSTRG